MTPHSHPVIRLARLLAIFCCMAGLASSLVPSSPRLLAQSHTQHVVQGKVVDKSDAGLKGATIFLKDGHSLAIRSYIAADDGTFRFGQVAQNTDYQLWAEFAGKKSSVKNISSFDSRAEFNITLKIDTK